MRTLILVFIFSMSIFSNAQNIAENITPLYERGAHSIEASTDNQIIFNFKNSKFKDIVRMDSIVFDSPEVTIEFFERIIVMLEKEQPGPDASYGESFGNVYLKRYGSFPTVVNVDTQKGFTYVSLRNAKKIIEVLRLEVQNI